MLGAPLNSGNAWNGYLHGDFGGSISNASFSKPSNGPRFDNLLNILVPNPAFGGSSSLLVCFFLSLVT